ncbi:MAG: NADPH-dependent F420 reductase [Acidimicrobiales bacterium]|jgi:predicted dinucleotide-binding enzyme
MEIAVVGTGYIGGILGRSLAAAGHDVAFASRHPQDDEVAAGTGARVVPVPDALAGAEVVVLALPGAAVSDFVAGNEQALAGKLVIDATNQMGKPVVNARGALPRGTRYARAFNTLGGENMADPIFAGVQADMFFSAPQSDRATVEAVISGVGLRPVFVGEDQEQLIDGLFLMWAALAMKQGRGRRMAFKLLEG